MGPEDQHPWDAQDEEIAQAFAAKDAEIERLRKVVAHYKARKLESLITELADVLEGYCWDESGLNHDPDGTELIERARKAIE